MLPEVGMQCIPVFEDNESAVQLTQNPISNSTSIHIDVRHHVLRELAGRKEISVTHVPSGCVPGPRGWCYTTSGKSMNSLYSCR